MSISLLFRNIGICAVATFIVCCTPNEDQEYISLKGETMGTYYSIKVQSPRKSINADIDSILSGFNKVFSTYDPQSIISQLNSSVENPYCFQDIGEHFKRILNISREVHMSTSGYFDPTVMPLVDYWGFSSTKFERLDVRQTDIDSLLGLVGFHKFSWSDGKDDRLCIQRKAKFASMDLSAVAKGYAVDLLARYLEENGSENYMVEIGGEIKAKGINQAGSWWRIGIDKPISSEDLSRRSSQAIIQLENRAIASSGNYRNFYEIDGKMVGHTINPHTGYPEINDLLAVSVLTADCVTADALATGFMALGFEEAIHVASRMQGIEAYFVVKDTSGGINTEYTDGFSEFIIRQD